MAQQDNIRREWLEKDYYKQLGVKKSDDAKTIKSAYRKLARELHPDANPDNKKAEDRFKAVSEAYDVVGDEKQRKAYDEARELYGSGGGMPGFGGFGGGRGGRGGASAVDAASPTPPLTSAAIRAASRISSADCLTAVAVAGEAAASNGAAPTSKVKLRSVFATRCMASRFHCGLLVMAPVRCASVPVPVPVRAPRSARPAKVRAPTFATRADSHSLNHVNPAKGEASLSRIRARVVTDQVRPRTPARSMPASPVESKTDSGSASKAKDPLARMVDRTVTFTSSCT